MGVEGGNKTIIRADKFASILFCNAYPEIQVNPIHVVFSEGLDIADPACMKKTFTRLEI